MKTVLLISVITFALIFGGVILSTNVLKHGVVGGGEGRSNPDYFRSRGYLKRIWITRLSSGKSRGSGR